LPEGGTNYRALLDTAIDAFNSTSAADRFLIILSDGEATDDDWRTRIATLKAKGIRVIGLGIGTEGGGMIPDGAGGFVKDDRGAVVMSRLEPNTLRELADATSGVYRDASSWLDLAALVRETVESGRTGSFTERKTVRLVERFQWPLALAVWCLLISFHYEFPVRPRVRDLKVRSSRAAPTPNVPPIIATALVLGLTLLARPNAEAASLAKSPRAKRSGQSTRGRGKCVGQDGRPASEFARAHSARLGRPRPRNGVLGFAAQVRPTARAGGTSE
jgi:Ca-activated chloride channel family protein